MVTLGFLSVEELSLHIIDGVGGWHRFQRKVSTYLPVNSKKLQEHQQWLLGLR